MRAEELLQRTQDETQDYGPPYFDCRIGNKNNEMQFPQRSLQETVDLFPWAKSLLVGAAEDFHLDLTENDTRTRIVRVV